MSRPDQRGSSKGFQVDQAHRNDFGSSSSAADHSYRPQQMNDSQPQYHGQYPYHSEMQPQYAHPSGYGPSAEPGSWSQIDYWNSYHQGRNSQHHPQDSNYWASQQYRGSVNQSQAPEYQSWGPYRGGNLQGYSPGRSQAYSNEAYFNPSLPQQSGRTRRPHYSSREEAGQQQYQQYIPRNAWVPDQQAYRGQQQRAWQPQPRMTNAELHASSNGSAASASDPNLAQVLQNWQQSALKSSLDRDPEARKALSNVFALDVECVAVGKSCSPEDRAVAQIGLVDANLRVVLNLYIKQEQPVVSYLTELTGLTAELLEGQGVLLSEAKEQLLQAMPEGSTLLSYGIDNDLEWLGLEGKRDRGELLDIKGYYRLEPGTRRLGRRAMGQDHIYRSLVGEVADQHGAVCDAMKSMHLYHLYKHLEKDVEEHRKALDKVEATEKKPPFKKLHPAYEGVCMGYRTKPSGLCKCKERKAAEASVPGKASGVVNGASKAPDSDLAGGKSPASQHSVSKGSREDVPNSSTEQQELPNVAMSDLQIKE